MLAARVLHRLARACLALLGRGAHVAEQGAHVVCMLRLELHQSFSRTIVLDAPWRKQTLTDGKQRTCASSAFHTACFACRSWAHWRAAARMACSGGSGSGIPIDTCFANAASKSAAATPNCCPAAPRLASPTLKADVLELSSASLAVVLEDEVCVTLDSSEDACNNAEAVSRSELALFARPAQVKVHILRACAQTFSKHKYTNRQKVGSGSGIRALNSK
jgi:hypothetical protein